MWVLKFKMIWTSWKNDWKKWNRRAVGPGATRWTQNGEQWITKKLCSKPPEVCDLSLVEYQTQYHAIIKNYISFLGYKNSSECQINELALRSGGQLACPLLKQVWLFIVYILSFHFPFSVPFTSNSYSLLESDRYFNRWFYWTKPNQINPQSFQNSC